VVAKLEGLQDARIIEVSDTFAAFEKFMLHWLCRAFEQGGTGADMLAIIQSRRNSFWFHDHRDGYEALTHAIALRASIAAAELHVETLDAGINRYVNTWHRADTAYRKFCLHVCAVTGRWR